MRCTNCGTEFEGTICPNCHMAASQPVPPQMLRCNRCGNVFQGSYCTKCGSPASESTPIYYHPYPDTKKEGPSDIQRMVTSSWLLYISVFFLAFSAFIALLWVGASIVIPGILSGSCADCQAYLLIITPQPVSILVFTGVPFLIYYIIVVVIITFCFFWLVIKDLPKAIKGFSKAMKSGGVYSSSRSAWTLLPQLFAFMAFFNIAYSLLLILSGIEFPPSQMDSRPLWYYLFSVASAAFWEEVIARTLLIGIPLFILAFIRYRGVSKPARFFIGGGFKVGIPEGTFLLFSSIMFGVAHTYSGGIWYFAPTFVGGLILGYIFLKRGIVASILFHFVWNYQAAFVQAAQATGNETLLLIGGAFTLFLVFIGLLLTIFYLGRMIGLFKSVPIQVVREGSESRAEPEGQAQAPPPPPPHVFKCPQCGWMEAAFEIGHFKCLRCGHVI
ncbi:MAG: CPBP family intramembrane metalloprotease [Methanobacteriota archaeon]|nr:MAG: CPBP family intramembrane metalloprotease [Euryarchaeota archaeon]